MYSNEFIWQVTYIEHFNNGEASFNSKIIVTVIGKTSDEALKTIEKSCSYQTSIVEVLDMKTIGKLGINFSERILKNQ